jgi:hypothetical protein
MSEIQHGKQRRETARKRAIRDALESKFQGTPALLDELRWVVLKDELTQSYTASAPKTRGEAA